MLRRKIQSRTFLQGSPDLQQLPKRVACVKSQGDRPVTRGAQKIFRPSGRMCWTQFKNIGHSSKSWAPLRKLFAPLDVPSWLRACKGTRRMRFTRTRRVFSVELKCHDRKRCSARSAINVRSPVISQKCAEVHLLQRQRAHLLA